MTTRCLLLLLCALSVTVSLPQVRQGGWWPSVLTFAPLDGPDGTPTSTTPATSTSTQGASQSTRPCDCPTPPQYNPVCGSDNQTYTNPQKLQCASLCGNRVTIMYLGTCQLGRK